MSGKRNPRVARRTKSRVPLREINTAIARKCFFFSSFVRTILSSTVKKHFQRGSALATDFHYRYDNIKQERIFAQAETIAYLSQGTFKVGIYLLILFIKLIFKEPITSRS